MEIEKETDGKNLNIKLIGRLDTNTSPQLDEELKTDLPNIENLVIDLEQLQYISSAGLRVMLSTQKIMNKQGTMKLINTQELVMEVFEATGFTDIMSIE